MYPGLRAPWQRIRGPDPFDLPGSASDIVVVISGAKLRNFHIVVNDELPKSPYKLRPEDVCFYEANPYGKNEQRFYSCQRTLAGSRVTIVRAGVEPLTLCEVEVYGPAVTGKGTMIQYNSYMMNPNVTIKKSHSSESLYQSSSVQ